MTAISPLSLALSLDLAAAPAFAFATPQAAAPAAIKAETEMAAKLAARPSESRLDKQEQAAPASAPALEQVKVSGVVGGGDTLSLKFAGRVPTVDLRQGQRQIILDLGNTQLTQGWAIRFATYKEPSSSSAWLPLTAPVNRVLKPLPA